LFEERLIGGRYKCFVMFISDVKTVSTTFSAMPLSSRRYLFLNIIYKAVKEIFLKCFTKREQVTCREGR